jgi:hypothetical protein
LYLAAPHTSYCGYAVASNCGYASLHAAVAKPATLYLKSFMQSKSMPKDGQPAECKQNYRAKKLLGGAAQIVLLCVFN